jgi:hypothetical protein
MQQVTTLEIYLKPAVALLCSVVFASIVLYGALLLLAVSHTASRAQLEERMQEIGGRVGALEAEYFELMRTVTLERAQELGFVPPLSSDTVFATAASKALTLEGLQNL